MIEKYCLIYISLLLGTVMTQFIGINGKNDLKDGRDAESPKSRKSVVKKNQPLSKKNSVPNAGAGKSKYNDMPPATEVADILKGQGFTSSADFFEILEKQFPGIKDLKTPMEATMGHIWSVLKEEPIILEEIMPVLKEMLETSKNCTDISDEKFVKWGNSLLNIYGPHLKKWMKALRDSPIESLVNKLEKINLDSDERQGNKVKEGLSYFRDVMKLALICLQFTNEDEPKSGSGFFDMFSSNSSDDDRRTEIMNKKSIVVGEEENLQNFQKHSTEELLNILDKMVPGMKKLWDPLEKMMANMWPLMKEELILMEQEMETFKEIVIAVEKNKNVNDTTIIKWGKEIQKSFGPYYKKSVEALQKSPIKDLKKKIELLDLDNLKEILNESQLNNVKEVLGWSHFMLTRMQEISEYGEVKKENPGWFQELSKHFPKIL